MFRSWEGKFPDDTAVLVSGDPAVDAGEAAEDPEWKVGFVEGTKQGAVLELLLDVDVDITRGKTGRGKVESGVAGVWW